MATNPTPVPTDPIAEVEQAYKDAQNIVVTTEDLAHVVEALGRQAYAFLPQSAKKIVDKLTAKLHPQVPPSVADAQAAKK